MLDEPKGLTPSPDIYVLTNYTFELIGRIVSKAADLEFAIFFMATAVDPSIEKNLEDTLKYRTKILKIARTSLDLLASELSLPNYLSRNEFFEEVGKALWERDGLAHGIILRVENKGLKAFHPKGDRYLDLDDQSLQATLQWLDKLVADAYFIRNTVWTNSRDDRLIQLGAITPPGLEQQPGTTLR
jgi:hypothetical protein